MTAVPGVGGAALSVGVLLALFVIGADAVRRRRRARLFAAFGTEAPDGPDRLGTGLVAAAAVLIGTALLGPRDDPAPGMPDAGTDVVLLLDVSRSMSVRDVTPDRGSVARLAALRIATDAGAARIGVAAFAADGYVLLPPTFDRGVVALYVDALDAGVVSGQGSDLARALGVAVETATRGGRRGSVVLLSDGEGFEEGDALARAVSEARRRRVAVHTVRVGTTAGGPVPDVVGAPRSAANPETLARIARETGGVAVDASDGAAVTRLAATLRRTSSARSSERAPTRASVGFLPAHALALVALLALLAEGALDGRRFP